MAKKKYHRYSISLPEVLGGFIDKIQKIEYHGWLSDVVAEALVKKFGHMRSYHEAEISYYKYKLLQVQKDRDAREAEIRGLAKKISSLKHTMEQQKKLKE